MQCARTCVVCRKVDEKKHLLRFVIAGGRTVQDGEAKIVFDGSYSHEGRGSYCHLACIHPLVGRELQRALQSKRSVEKREPVAHESIKVILEKGIGLVRNDELRDQIQALLASGNLSSDSAKVSKRGKRGIRL